MRTPLASAAVSILLAAAACGSSPTTSGDSPDAGGSGSATVDAGSDADGFSTLITTAWSVPSGTEKYLCVRVTVQSDLWISAIKPISPTGTHHEVLMLVTNPTIPDGVTECDSSLTDPAIYASGVGSQEFDFPTGLGLHITGGQQLFLNLHLFNTSEDTITGTSGISYMPGDEASIVHPSGTVLAGKTTGLVVVPGESTQVGTCTTPAGLTMFAVAPHMHLLGSHMNVTYTPSEGAPPITVLDTDYSFDDQLFHNITPIVTTAGGKYVVTCTYVNTTGEIVRFGESTTDEMCFAMTLLYPPQTQTTCTQ